MMSSDVEICYEYNNMIYTITGTHELHQHLQTDSRFFSEYIANHDTTLEMQAPNNCTQDGDSFVWTTKKILLLLDELEKSKLDLRNSKIKKRDIWRQIKVNMLLKGVENVTEDIIERKFRNMKSTFKNIKDNKKKTATGRGEIKWEFYDSMEKIFEEDKTINIGHTISSLNVNPASSTQIRNSLSPSTIPDCDTPTTFSTALEATGSLSPTEDSSNSFSISASCSAVPTASQKTRPLPKHREKAEKSKQLYNLRKKQLDVEENRLQELALLRKSIEENNKIQEERNKLFKEFLDKQK